MPMDDIDDLSQYFNRLILYSGGEAGIRTLGTPKGTTVFETAPIDRSGTSPLLRRPQQQRGAL